MMSWLLFDYMEVDRNLITTRFTLTSLCKLLTVMICGLWVVVPTLRKTNNNIFDRSTILTALSFYLSKRFPGFIFSYKCHCSYTTANSIERKYGKKMSSICPYFSMNDYTWNSFSRYFIEIVCSLRNEFIRIYMYELFNVRKYIFSD